MKKHKIALVLGAGGSRGLANIGVLKVLDELGIKADYIIGSSMGALVGALYASGKTGQEIEHIILKTNIFSMFETNIFKGHLFNEQKMSTFLEKHIFQKTFAKLQIPLKINALNINSGREIVFEKGNIHKAILASIALPGLFKPVIYQKQFIIDGGITNPTPLNLVPKNCSIIAVDVSFAAKTITTKSSTIDLVLKTFSHIQQNSHRYYLLESQMKPDNRVLLKPQLGFRNIIDFRDEKSIIRAGEVEARRLKKELVALIR